MSVYINQDYAVKKCYNLNPFGMAMAGRSYNSSNYRFGFNGMLKDDEVKGIGNSYTTEFRQYDPRLGRWLSIDPEFKAFAWQSPYVAFDNNPIAKVDPRGDAAGDPEKITKAASNAVDKVTESDNGSQPAKCNIGVNSAFTEITGSKELSGKRANEMFDQMASSKNFTPIDVSEAQEAANNGDVVIAAYKASSGSGHVALVVPGEASMNGTWNSQNAKSIGGIPKLMDTGAGKRTKEQAANYSFGKGKQDDVVFYKYTPVISNPNSNEIQASAKTTIPKATISNKYQGSDQYQSTVRATQLTLGQKLQENRMPIVKNFGDVVRFFEKFIK